MRVVTVEEMRRIEAAADERGHSYADMMERAGRGAAEAVMARQDVQGMHVLVLAGPGNNGGDGLVAARHLAKAGAEVACYLLKPRAEEDAHLLAVQKLGLRVADATNDKRWRVLRKLIADADIIVDALLGTGVRLPLGGTVADLLAQVKLGLKARRARRVAAGDLRWLGGSSPPAAAPVVVAVDGPSGLAYDSGDLDPRAVPADLTVTFAYPKQGHFLFPGASACGEVAVADIGVEPKLTRELLGEAALEVATPEMVGPLMPDRPRDAHKGTFGRALLITGSISYTGAAFLAAGGAARAGAGLVTLAVPAAIHGALAASISEATYLILPEVMGIVAPDAVGLVMEKAKDYQAVLLGPGLTKEKESVEFIHRLLRAEVHPQRRGHFGFQAGGGTEIENPEGEPSAFPPLVVDADALNALAALEEEWWQWLPAPSVLTPHPGEMARLMGVSTREVQAERLKAARDMAARWGHVVLLKGAYSILASPDGRTVVLPFAVPALATAGSGDVLSGAITGLLAQGLSPFDAALAGAYLHGLAGSWVNEEVGPAGAVASDLLSRLPRALRTVSVG